MARLPTRIWSRAPATPTPSPNPSRATARATERAGFGFFAIDDRPSRGAPLQPGFSAILWGGRRPGFRLAMPVCYGGGMRTSDQLLAELRTLHPKLIDLSLGRIERLLARLGNPEARLPPVVHVAGTNGKGSTAAYLKAMLQAADKRVHVYTSPHLVRFNERIELAGADGKARPIGEAELADGP